jgi:hypothetical protein
MNSDSNKEKYNLLDCNCNSKNITYNININNQLDNENINDNMIMELLGIQFHYHIYHSTCFIKPKLNKNTNVNIIMTNESNMTNEINIINNNEFIAYSFICIIIVGILYSYAVV